MMIPLVLVFSSATTQKLPLSIAAARAVTVIVGTLDRKMEEKVSGCWTASVTSTARTNVAVSAGSVTCGKPLFNGTQRWLLLVRSRVTASFDDLSWKRA